MVACSPMSGTDEVLLTAVTCERCGQSNPDELRFCRDCGARLKGTASADSHHSATRPAAPDFNFSPKPTLDCAHCGTTNPPDSRFCAECGQRLEDGTMVGAPMVDLGETKAEPDPQIACARCRGSNPPGTTFCQYCGSRLEPTASSAASPSAASEPARTHPESREPITQPRPGTLKPQGFEQAPHPNPALSRARLVVIAQDGSTGRSYPLDSEQLDIGRLEGSIQLPNDPFVSPRHARIRLEQGRWYLRDLDSDNGVFTRIRDQRDLRDGDLVLLGLEVLRFEVVGETDKGYGPAYSRGTRVFGSPIAPRFGRLLQRTGEGVTRDIYHLTREETVVGREVGDIVFTSDPFMSRRHAAIRYDETSNRFVLQDLNSSNGTYVALRKETRLEQGDHIRVGQHLFRVELDS